MTNYRYLMTILAITAMSASGCAKKDSIAQAAEVVNTVPATAKAIQNDPKAQVQDQVKHQITTFDLEGLADDGSKKWDVKGQSAESVTEDQVRLNNITASSYGKEAQATITADTGLYNKTKNNIHLEQNVKAVIENTGSGAADLMGAASQAGAQGQAMSAPSAGKSKKTKTVITCDAEVEFNYEKNEGYFSKNVHVVNDEGIIDADKITIYLDKGTKTIQTIVAEGNVKIHRGENITYSDKATYIEADKKIVLTGQPKLVIYQEGDTQVNLFGTEKK